MQRDLRFRAWDYKISEMSESLELNDAMFGPIGSANLNISRYNLMQFTGLHDKNGKEIYEGDWCRFTHRGEAFQTKQGVVEFYNTGFRAVVDDKDDAWTLDRYYEIEVIGNIYENKELMEQIYD